MTGALTLTEAAERLAPVFTEETESASRAVAAKPKGKWMSLEHAGAVLAERVTGQQPAPKKQKAEVTVQQAAKQIEKPETPAALSELRGKRLVTTATKTQRWIELQDFINRAQPYFEGKDDPLADPQLQEVYSYAQQLRAAYDWTVYEEQEAWKAQCLAENEVFELERPDWSPADATRVIAFLNGLGVSEQEMWQLWLTPQPIDVTSPVCLKLAEAVVDDPEPIPAALGSVGFEDAEIKAVMSGEASIILRDHRIQELVARAADVDTPTEDRAAA